MPVAQCSTLPCPPSQSWPALSLFLGFIKSIHGVVWPPPCLLQVVDVGVAAALGHTKLDSPSSAAHTVWLGYKVAGTAGGLQGGCVTRAWQFHTRHAVHDRRRIICCSGSTRAKTQAHTHARPSHSNCNRCCSPPEVLVSGDLTPNSPQSHPFLQAPEVLVSGELTPAADVWSWAVLLWELHTGRFAWEGCTAADIRRRVAVRREALPMPPEAPAWLQVRRAAPAAAPAPTHMPGGGGSCSWWWW